MRLKIILAIPEDWTGEMAQTLANRLEGELPAEIEPKIVADDEPRGEA